MISPINVDRVNLFFTDHRFSWSETYWRPGVTLHTPGVEPLASTLSAVIDGYGLAYWRVQLLGAGVELAEVRVSNDNVFRDSLVDTSYSKWQRPLGAASIRQIYNNHLCDVTGVCPPAAEPEVCLRLRMEAGSQHRRIMYLSGLPDYFSFTGANAEFLITPGAVGDVTANAWNTAFRKFVKYLTNKDNQWGYVGVKNPPDAFQQVTGVTRAGGDSGDITVTTQGNHGFGIGQTVLLSRCKYNPGSLNVHGRVEIVAVPTPSSLTFHWPDAGKVDYLNGGKVFSVTLEFQLFTKVIGDTINEHKRGVAELAIRGRSRSRKRFVG